MYAYFKLFNSIKDEHEVELARLEIESLVGPVEPVRSSVDVLRRRPMDLLIDATQATLRGDESDIVRFQDYLCHETAYGQVQGFESTRVRPYDVRRLVHRLGYTREIYIADETTSWDTFLRSVFPQGSVGKNCNVFFANGVAAVRIITSQYFLENSEYITKVTSSLERERVNEFVDSMFDNLMRHIYRIPASAKARVGKRFLDYLAERGENSLYLSHGLHPYKGKFHPKMARALVNIVCPGEEGTIMDNFAGSGTLLVESSLMGLDSCGVEINPMSVLMSNAKCALMHVNPAQLDAAIAEFLKEFQSELNLLRVQHRGQVTLETSSYPPDPDLYEQIRAVAPDVYHEFEPNHVLEEIVLARRIVEERYSGDIRNLLMLGLAMCISDLKGKKHKDFRERIATILEDIYRRCALFNQLKEILQLKIGRGIVYQADATDLSSVDAIRSIHGNVNSPPYSTALDYIGNDISQLALLGLVRSPEELRALEDRMGGNPRAKHDDEEMRLRVRENTAGLPGYAITLIRLLEHYGKKDHAYRLYDFYCLMKQSLAEQMRVLERNAQIATVIGNNHFKLTDTLEEVEPGHIAMGSTTCAVEIHNVRNNIKALQLSPITGDELALRYGENLPVKVWISGGAADDSNGGVYVEVENERVILLLGAMLGFRPRMVINRYLEKTLRGNIRYESIVVMQKP